MNYNEKVYEFIIIIKSDVEKLRKASILERGEMIAESEEIVKMNVIRELDKSIATEEVIIKVRPF